MNLIDYENKYFLIYEAFAKTVRFILNRALIAANNLPLPQSFQSRAKGIDSLRRRLSEEGQLDTETLELARRDLAGIRLIFYTNNDVDRFITSPLIRENFEIEEDSTKIHHPIPENDEVRYRAIHYTVRLREDRISLPEYAKFSGLRCEIQVQTILNHAWSETSHDILYKDKVGYGYGGKAIKDITRRFERIMDKYLIPAGFEIQKAQQDYERLLQGKELFDNDIVYMMDHAQNNNERHSILLGLRDYAIPNLDDLPAAFKELKDSLLRTVKAARDAGPVSRETTFGNMQGLMAVTVIRLVVEIVAYFRYVEVIGTLQLLIDIYRDEPNTHIRQQIVNVVKIQSEYNIEAYNQVGLMIQMALLGHLAAKSHAEIDSIRPIALSICTAALQPEITGATWKADEVVLSRGSVPPSDQLWAVRDKAITALFAIYSRASDDAQKQEILSALDAATRTPIQAQYSNELLSATLTDDIRIVDFVTARANAESYELLQHLEHRFLIDYLLAHDLTSDGENRFNCQDEAIKLMAAIMKFRETVNADKQYVRYKILIGFESVYPSHWTDKEFDYQRSEEYRRDEADSFINEINTENEKDWFKLITRCAETKSNDLMTFPFFGNFISKLAERKPEVAERFLEKGSDVLLNFLPGFLNGLVLSGRTDIYQRVLERELESARSLSGLARHLRFSDINKPYFSDRLLKKAISQADTIAVIQCLLLAIEHYGTEKIADSNTFLFDSLTFLTDHKDARWVREALFLQKETTFYEELPSEITALVLQNLSYLYEVDYQAERVLIRLAEHHLEAIWDYFGTRFANMATEDKDEKRFEAVPFQFHGLEKELSKNTQLAIKKSLLWFIRDPMVFQFRGGRMLSKTFPNCTSEFASALTELVKSGGETEADFVLAILQNYNGETSTHIILKEIVSKFPSDSSKMRQVARAIDSTGVVSGEFGFVAAWRTKKVSLTEWLVDERQEVKEFAEKHITELNIKIASEQRHAEGEREMRKMSYDDDAGNEANP